MKIKNFDSPPEDLIQGVVDVSKADRALPKLAVQEKSLPRHLNQSLAFLALSLRNSEKSKVRQSSARKLEKT